MAKDNARPIIIKRVKKVSGGGHHGGAWKVAYADFVTAMMAFFLMMWLLNATTESQRKGLADYFAPTIALSRTSGGGQDSFGGDNVFSQDSLSQSGTGANADESTHQIVQGAAGSQENDTEITEATENRLFRRLETMLKAKAGESDAAREILRHIQTRVTDEGLVVEIFDLPGEPLFRGDTLTPSVLLEDLIEMIGSILNLVKNDVAVAGHIASRPVVVLDNPNWDLSTARAQFTREALEGAGVESARMRRVTGHADRSVITPDPMDVRNNRLEITIIRSDVARQ